MARGSRFTMRGSTLVPPELPVLRPPAVDNSAARWVVKQPRPPIGTTNPGRVSLPYLWTAAPSEFCALNTLSDYCGAIQANEQIMWGRNSRLTLCADYTGPMEWKTLRTGYIHNHKKVSFQQGRGKVCGQEARDLLKQGLVRCGKRNTNTRDTVQSYPNPKTSTISITLTKQASESFPEEIRK